MSRLTNSRSNNISPMPGSEDLSPKKRKPVPHEFVLDAIASLAPRTHSMFGCLAVYVKNKIVLILRDKVDNNEDTMYSASGIAKARGDWLTGQVLWTHLHDQYQTTAAWLIMRATPTWGWWFLQGLVLLFEVGAPLWFSLPWTRKPALVIGFGMHVMIGLMFGPVIWFALLMASMLVATFLPDRPLRRLFSIGASLGRPRRRAV